MFQSPQKSQLFKSWNGTLTYNRYFIDLFVALFLFLKGGDATLPYPSSGSANYIMLCNTGLYKVYLR